MGVFHVALWSNAGIPIVIENNDRRRLIGKKRQGTAALQNALRDIGPVRTSASFWSAPVLWRFGLNCKVGRPGMADLLRRQPDGGAWVGTSLNAE